MVLGMSCNRARASSSLPWAAAIEAFTAATFYTQFGIPEDVKGSNGMAAGIVRREATHGLDLGRWFTQPCLIVVGFLSSEPVDAPVGVYVDGKLMPSQGTTMVRWILPLPDAPPSYRGAEAAAPK